jgi:hypothetical protein
VSTAVHTASSAGTHTAIAVDSNDDIHIAYRYNTGADLYHATVQGHNPGSVTRTGVTGATCTVTPALPAGLSLTPGTCTLTGTPTVGKATATYNLTATSSTGLSKNGEFTIQVFDPPLISYSPSSFTLTKGTVMSPTATPTNTGGAILSGIVDSGSSVGSHTSITLDSNGYKHISYYDTTSDDLKYATDKSGSWVTTSIDTSGNVGYYTSIAIDSNDDVHISYLDDTNNDLKYATDKSGSWVTTSIDTSGIVGYFTSIGIDSNDDVHISYYDTTNGDLKYATDKSGSWVTTSIDTSGNVGTYTSIAIDSNDDVHISYYDTTNGDLKYATDKSGSWVTTSIDTSGNVGYYTSIAIDSNDAVHISYHDTTNGDLKYATDKSGSWVTTSVDTSGTVGRDTSIAIDSNDDVHISYYDATNGDLKYATDKSGSWVTTSIDTSGNVGYYTSIAIDSNDAVHISYRDATDDALNYIGLDSSSNVYGYSVSPALPAGLSLNFATGEISGTPTATTSSATYTITARNSGGTGTTTVTIVVNDELPVIAYSPSSFTLTKGTAMTTVTPTTSGGAIVSWSISPTLPTGLAFDTSTGAISGTPTVLSVSTAYTVTATNTGGSDTAAVTIVVNDALPVITYSPSSFTLTKGTTMTTVTPTASGGAIVSWSISPTLPTGLVFDTSTGAISGTPTVLSVSTAYTVTATNTGGSDTAAVTIVVNDELPVIAYSPNAFTLTKGTAMTTVTPTTSGGAIVSWSISPTLPTGLVFDTSTGAISGTPTVLSVSTAYTVTATNTGGSDTAAITIVVNDALPVIAYSPNDLSMTNNTASSDLPLSPTITGLGAIVSWALDPASPALPTGLSLSSSTGVLSGTPTELISKTMFIIRGTNTGGSTTAYLNITVVDQVPTLAFTPNDLDMINNTASSDLPLAPTITGAGDIVSWTIAPSLPDGLVFSTLTGTISGTPTALLVRTSFVISGTNTGGTATAYLNITVVDQVPVLTYAINDLDLTNNTAMMPLLATLTGPGDIASWALVGSLPTGLNFGSTNGSVWGTPTITMTRTAFQVFANNTGGSTDAWFNITVVDVAPNLEYNPENRSLVRAVTMASMNPSVTGIIDSWSIHPDLPAGLLFTDGVISGTPTVNMTRTSYIVWANNTGGSASHSINITIVEPNGDLSYNPSDLQLIRGEIIAPLSPTYSGGAVETWEIYPDLPTGLNFNTGMVSGTPTVNLTITMFTVWANNSGGVSSATINITIFEPVVSLSYTPENITLIRTVAMNTFAPSVSGGNVEVWAIYPGLPSGLIFADGAITGTPLVNMTRTNYTIFANTTGGSISASINITILEPLGVLVYDPATLGLTRGVVMTPAIPTLSQGMPSSWAIEPELPLGLTFFDGTISGTPLENTTAIVYTVWANHSGGSASTTVSITVNEPLPIIGFSPDNLTLMRYEAMTPHTSISTGGFVEAWTISPALPDGLIFANGTVSGTSLLNLSETVFTVTATNSGGSVSVMLYLTVLEPQANLSIEMNDYVLTRSEGELNFTINNSGGFVASWEIEPALPPGITLVDGVIHGTSLANRTLMNYTVWANNTGGSSFVSFTLTVLEPVASISYPTIVFELVNGVSWSYIVPTLGGGMVDTWAIEPSLPDGLWLADGQILGVPETNLSESVFTVWGNNSGGSANSTFTLVINQPLFLARYPTTLFVLDLNESIGTLEPLYYFDEDDEPVWSITPTLPDGFTFEGGVISGFGLVPQNLTTYTVQVRGKMLPVNISLMIEIIETNSTFDVVSVRNETEAGVFVLPEPVVVPEQSFSMYWICPLIALLLLLVGLVAYERIISDEEKARLIQGEDEVEDKPVESSS